MNTTEPATLPKVAPPAPAYAPPAPAKMAQRFSPGFIVLPVGLLAGLLVLGVLLWHSYRTDLMNNQKEQLRLVTQSLSQNMQDSFTEYRESLALFAKTKILPGGNDAFYKDYLTSHAGRIADIRQETPSGTLLRSAGGLVLQNPVHLAEYDDTCTLWQEEDAAGRHYLSFRQRLADGSCLCLVLDEEDYYEALISDLHIGTNGYIVIKTSTGRIVMHPDRAQWGIYVISGRMRMFPNLDYTSLSEMIDRQQREPSGVYEYTSYWWTDPALPKVKKVSAHNWAALGSDHFIVSAVVDTTDLSAPIYAGMQKLAAVYLGVLAILVGLAVYIGKLLHDRQRTFSEIHYLRSLNAVLEQLHKQEDSLAHQQRLQVMGAMTGGIAHEFNNFLTPILGFSELLMGELPPESDTYDSAREIYDAADKAKDVIHQISALSRKNVETVYRLVPAKKTLHHTLKMMESVCPPNVRLKSDLALGDQSFLGNPTQLNQVLLNLCMNAIHAMRPDGGELTVRALCVSRNVVATYVRAESISDTWERYLEIDVADTGCGMDSETLRQIFEPFFTTKKSGEGTGLGLALAEQIIHAHHGYITAESTVGEGSTFRLFLPVAEAGAANESLAWGQTQQLHLVVADDNPKVRAMLKKSFEKLGLSITVCGKKAELLAELQTTEVDVLAIDQTMADCAGIEFCMAIQGKYPDTVKLLMADTVDREVLEACQHYIIDGYVEKPVSDTALLAAVRRCRVPGTGGTL